MIVEFPVQYNILDRPRLTQQPISYILTDPHNISLYALNYHAYFKSGLRPLTPDEIYVYLQLEPALARIYAEVPQTTLYYLTVLMGGNEEPIDFSTLTADDYPALAANRMFHVNNDREATLQEYNAVQNTFFDTLQARYFFHTGALAATVAAYTQIPAYAKTVPHGIRRALLIALAIEAGTHGTVMEILNQEQLNRVTASTFQFYVPARTLSRNHNAVGYNQRNVNYSADAGQTFIAAAGQTIRIDYGVFIQCCQQHGITVRQFFRRFARASFFQIAKTRRIRFELGKQSGVPAAYGYLGTDFFDTCEMTVVERAVYDAFKQVALNRAARSEMINSANMYTAGRIHTAGASGRFPRLGQ